jgi:hypothetical protein
MAFLGHLIGITLMIAAVTQVGDPSAFWILMLGAATLAVGQRHDRGGGQSAGGGAVSGGQDDALNYFHAFFPIGIVAGGSSGFADGDYGGGLGLLAVPAGVIYIPIAIYGWMLLPQPCSRRRRTRRPACRSARCSATR